MCYVENWGTRINIQFNHCAHEHELMNIHVNMSGRGVDVAVWGASERKPLLGPFIYTLI